MAYNNVNALAILTRPQGKNEKLAAQLGLRGIGTLVLPALHIQGAACPPAALPLPCNYDLVIFVSSTAVQLYCRQLTSVTGTWQWPAHTFAATVGQASAQALYDDHRIAPANILHPDADAKQQDSEALWSVLQPLLPKVRRVLIVRGQGGRDWLANQLQQAGCHVDRHAAYQRMAQCWTLQQTNLLETRMAGQKAIICLVTSSQSAEAIHENIERHYLAALWKPVRFVTIHPRIASRLQSLFASGAGTAARHIAVCSPHDAAIAHAIEAAAS